MKSDNVIFTVGITQEPVFSWGNTYEIIPSKLDDKGEIYFNVNKNSIVSWEEWNSCLKPYNVTKRGKEHVVTLDETKNNESLQSSLSLKEDGDGFNYIVDALSEGKQDDVKKFLGYIKNAVSYYKIKNSDSQGKLTTSSAISFIEFMRYIPAFYNKDGIKVYIDDRTGFFGVIYKKTSSNSGTLNILVKDNYEIDFSFAKRRKGVITITGVAKFGKHLDNSGQIRSVFKLME